MPLDRVQVLKQEDAAGGGDPLDDVDFLNSPIEPQEDAIESAGLYLQSATARDENVLLTRDSGGNLTFQDTNHTSPVTLTNLLSIGGSTLHAGFVDVIIAQNTDYSEGSVTGLTSPPSLVVPALGRDISSVIIDDDYIFQMVVTGTTATGYNYIVTVSDEGERDDWPGPGGVTVRFDYFWSE